MKFKKYIFILLTFAMFNLAISPYIVAAEEQSDTSDQSDDVEKTLELLSDEDNPTLDLIDEMPMQVAEKGTFESAKWLNEHNTKLKGNFVADEEYVKFVPEKSGITVESAGSCAWEVTKSTALNFIPWAKILKVKQVAKGLGGFAKLTKLIYNSYKHQRNIGLTKKKALKKAVKNVVSSNKFGNAKVEAVYQFFELDGVFKECFK
ncbi:hypothetical protein ACOSZA_09865 [Mammaliicoccus sciuri]|uniref:hypothetical protein n=1 Tax=Mammaliicoccus sciuri TaxID=1296 RepID=UPI003BA126D1